MFFLTLWLTYFLDPPPPPGITRNGVILRSARAITRASNMPHAQPWACLLDLIKAQLLCWFLYFTKKICIHRMRRKIHHHATSCACGRGKVCCSVTRALHAGLKQHSWTSFSSSTKLLSGPICVSQRYEHRDPQK